MPYFKNNKINLLLIHIPKTGGTSLEKYFSEKYNIPLNYKSLFSITSNPQYHIPTEKKTKLNYNLQHYTYNDIVEYKHLYNIDFNNITILSCVRNPYERAVSDLFHLNLISKNDDSEKVYQKLKNFINKNFDNHSLPQYKYLSDKSNKLIKEIIIMRFEKLNECMEKLSYTDFKNINEKKNRHGISRKDYIKYLNKDSIQLINEFYKMDFLLFSYKMINPNQI